MKYFYDIDGDIVDNFLEAMTKLIFTLNTPEKVDYALWRLRSKHHRKAMCYQETLVRDAIHNVYQQIPGLFGTFNQTQIVFERDIHVDFNDLLSNFIRPLGNPKSCLFAQISLENDYDHSENNDGFTQLEKDAIAHFIAELNDLLAYISVVFPHVRKAAVSRSAKSPKSPSTVNK